MLNTHPTATGGTPHDYLKSYAKKAPIEADESNFIRCYQCGMLNDVTKISVGDARDEMSSLLKTTTVTTPTGTTDVIETDDSKQHGCRFCHSLNVDGHNLTKEGPRKVPVGYRG